MPHRRTKESTLKANSSAHSGSCKGALDLCLTKYWAFTRPLGIHRQLGADPTPTTVRHPTNGLQPAQTGLEPKRHVFRFLSFRQHKQTYRTNFLANRMHMACRCLCTEPLFTCQMAPAESQRVRPQALHKLSEWNLPGPSTPIFDAIVDF